MSHLLAGGARAFIFHVTSVDQVPGVQPQGLGVAQQHLRLAGRVGVLRIHVVVGGRANELLTGVRARSLRPKTPRRLER